MADGRRTGMDMIRDAAEVASLHAHSHRTWVTIDINRIEKTIWRGQALKIQVDRLFEDTDIVLAPLWRQIAAT
jgi:hypothetical protein